jgi:CMP-N,N'-diacetyllegionaminic acid synthase
VLEGRTILVVVPARGGSKGVPLKNIRPLLGRPLIAYTADVVKALDYVDRAVVSTDHPEIAHIAEQAGLSVPFLRPADISGDRISDVPVLIHALTEMEQRDGRRYDVVVMLQPTAPLRQPTQVDAAIRKLLSGDWDSVWTVSPTDLKYHPLKQLNLDAAGAVSYFDPRGAGIIARQQLEPIYHRNGVAYALTRGCLLDHQSLLGRRGSAVVIEEKMLSIDTVEDFEQTEALLRANNAGDPKVDRWRSTED